MRQIRLTDFRTSGTISMAVCDSMRGRVVCIEARTEVEAERVEKELADLGVVDVKRGGRFVEIDGTTLH